MAPTLEEVYVMVTDLDQSVQFYDEEIGLSVRKRGDRSATFKTASGTLKIEEDFDAETLANFGLEPPGDDRGKGVIIVLEVADADRIYDGLNEHEVDIIKEPSEVPWGRKMFLVRDPDGYVLEIYHPL